MSIRRCRRIEQKRCMTSSENCVFGLATLTPCLSVNGWANCCALFNFAQGYSATMAKECPFRMARTSSTRKRRMRGIGVKRFASVPSPAPSARPLPQAGEATSADARRRRYRIVPKAAAREMSNPATDETVIRQRNPAKPLPAECPRIDDERCACADQDCVRDRVHRHAHAPLVPIQPGACVARATICQQAASKRTSSPCT